MNTSIQELEEWLRKPESEHLEFKAARENFQFDKLLPYCVALANEGGGKMVLGVTDKRPRRVVGTNAFSKPEHTVGGLVERLRLKVRAEEIGHPDGRVLVFHVPSRPIGMPLEVGGAYLMRIGESLRPMTQDGLRNILLEAGPDFSAEVCTGATVSDLDSASVERFLSRWSEQAGKPSHPPAALEQRLEDAELLVGGKITYAALVLFGTRAALGRHLAQTEIIFEYRSSPVPAKTRHCQPRRPSERNYIDSLPRPFYATPTRHADDIQRSSC